MKIEKISDFPGSRQSQTSNGALPVKRLLTVAELSEFLGLPKSWIYDRTRKGGPEQIPHIRLGKYVRFELEAVEIFLRQHRASYQQKFWD